MACFLYLEILCLLFIFAQVGLSICPYLLYGFHTLSKHAAGTTPMVNGMKYTSLSLCQAGKDREIDSGKQ